MALCGGKCSVTALTVAGGSADGICAIEVAQTAGARGSYIDLREAAEEMSEVCMEYKERPEGAIASNIGKVSQNTSTVDVNETTITGTIAHD